MSSGWSWYVIVITLLNVFCWFWLLWWARTKRVSDTSKDATLGHTYDGIAELDLPLPRWWLWMFIGTIIFAVGYLIAYPGLGNFPGVLNWTSSGQWQQELAAADARYGPIYADMQAQGIPDLAKNRAAVEMGQRLFANNCARCHGSDARGGPGFPNLADHDWLYGGEPENIELSILNGRAGVMPPFAPALGGEENVQNVIAYVRSLSGLPADAAQAAKGKEQFMTICVACHGADGKGNQALGAPNLTDDVWLYGSSPATIEQGLRMGRNGMMPAHADILGPAKAHVVAAYVYGLSQNGKN